MKQHDRTPQSVFDDASAHHLHTSSFSCHLAQIFYNSGVSWTGRIRRVCRSA
jgi:hypothetical protein